MTRIEEQQTFLERDVELLHEQARILLARIDELSARLGQIEGRLDSVLDAQLESDVLDEVDLD